MKIDTGAALEFMAQNHNQADHTAEYYYLQHHPTIVEIVDIRIYETRIVVIV